MEGVCIVVDSSDDEEKVMVISSEDEVIILSSDDDQTTMVKTTKRKKTKRKVASLYELCCNVLYNCIEALEYTGGVPYSILKPVLTKLNPDQLFGLEQYNSYLIKSTEELWEAHVKRDFKSCDLNKNLSWRNLYLKTLDDNEKTRRNNNCYSRHNRKKRKSTTTLAPLMLKSRSLYKQFKTYDSRR